MNIPKKTTRKDQLKKYRDNIPDIYNGAYIKLYDKAMTGKSRVAAMKAKCLDCVCWQGAEISRCGVPTCPLYPYTHKKELKDDILEGS